VAATRGSHIAPITDYSCRADLRTCFDGPRQRHATLAQYLSLESTRTRTIEQWDYLPDDDDAFPRFHLRFKSGLRKAGKPKW